MKRQREFKCIAIRALQAHDGQRHFHTTILGGIADVTKHRHAFELVDNHGSCPVLPLPVTSRRLTGDIAIESGQFSDFAASSPPDRVYLGDPSSGIRWVDENSLASVIVEGW